MLEKYKRSPYDGTLRDAGRQEVQKIVEEEAGRSWNELRFLAAD
jgi:hypothetical protein